VSKKSKLIILDEPTAVLTVKETDIFFNLVRELKRRNVAVLFISHRIEEVFDLCDRVTVLCDGRKIVTKDIGDVTRAQLISFMVGREIKDNYPRPDAAKPEVLLKGENLCNKKIKNVSFEVHKGEIVGFGGLVGAGRTELGQAIFGADKIESGRMTYKGKPYSPSSPREALLHGIGLLPEDRKTKGAIQMLSVRFNQSVSVLDKCKKGIMISKAKERKISDKYINELSIKTPSREQIMRFLSGGNQQKVVLSKILARDCDLIIFDEPTRGIDVNAKQEIYQIMKRLVEEGKSIIMISSDMPELMGMSNRIYVMSTGHIVGELTREEFTQERILEMASVKY
jgi:ribose transport system ATP-binding protein